MEQEKNTRSGRMTMTVIRLKAVVGDPATLSAREPGKVFVTAIP